MAQHTRPFGKDEVLIRKFEPGEKIIRPDPILEAGKQFLAGVRDVTDIIDIPLEAGLGTSVNEFTGFLARPFEKVFGTIEFTPQGPQYLSPDEVTQRLQESGRQGLPSDVREPSGLFEQGARFAGQTAVLGPVLGKAATAVRAPGPVVEGATRLQRLRRGGRGFVSGVGENFAASPLQFTATETALGFVAGAGGFIAEQIVPDSPAAKLVGELSAPTLLALTPTALFLRAIGGLRGMVSKVRSPFTPEGGEQRAIARFQRAATPEQRETALAELDKPTTLVVGAEEEVLSVPQRTGIPGLLSLERAVVESSEELVREADSQIARANARIQESLLELGKAPTTVANIPIGVAQRELDNLLEVNFRIAAQRVDERIAQLGPKVTAEQANRIGAEELTKVHAVARKQREELFAVVPEDTAVPFGAVEAGYNAFVKQLGRPAQKDIPAVAKQFLSKKSDDYFGANLPPGFQKGETRIKDIRALSSELRQVARNARAGDSKNLNQARIADDLANLILKDLDNAAAGPEVSKALEIAVGFSRDMADRFNKGTVGKLLGRRVAGDPVVPAGLTFEQSIGVAGPRAREAIDDLEKAFTLPDAPSSRLLVEAAEDFTRSRFLRETVNSRGEFNVAKAERWALNNEELLNRLPSVREEIDAAIVSSNKLAVVERQRGRVNLTDPKISKATMLLQKGPVETFRQVARLRPKDAATETQQLINRMKTDTTGEALEGLKSGFAEFLLASAKSSGRDVEELSFISGFKLRDLMQLSGVRAIADRLLSKDELDRLGMIAQDLIRLEQRRVAKLPKEGVIGDKPSRIVNTASRLFGAGLFRNIAAKFGFGGTVQIPGEGASAVRDIVAAGIRDPGGRLIRDSIFDEKLFREFLQASLDEGTGAMSRVAARRLNAWVITVLADYGGRTEEQEDVPGALF